MARFVSLERRAACSWLAAGGLGLMACFSTSLRAQVPMAPVPAPAKTPAANAAPVAPSLPPDTLGRYGKILMPSDELAHPLKLKLPFPDAGEVKIPSQDELTMREKLEQLAKLSDSEIRLQLSQWPAYANMSLRDEGLMLQRIQDFRDYRTKVAMQKAHDLGLLSTLTPDQKIRFEKDYWDKRLQMDRDLARQFEPIFKARNQELKDELFREFSSPSLGPVAQATNKSPQASPSPVTSAPATNMAQPMEPMAQAPR
jgi:hypothetical protein